MSTAPVADFTTTPRFGCVRSGTRPPVVILNMYYSGLGIARALAGKGVRVVGLSADPGIYGNFTKLCEVRSAPSSQDQPEELADFLSARSEDLEGAVIFPTRDADVRFLDRFRSELETRYILSIPSAASLRKTIDKYELASAAKLARVSTPKTLLLNSHDDLGRIEHEIGFPCVLKPVSAFHWRTADAWRTVGARKAIRVGDGESLRKEYAALAGLSTPILVQEWIDGPTDRIVVLGGYADADSRLLAHFTARKILQTPDDCGTGCIVQSEPLPELLAPAERLLKALRYQGMAEIEYKYDSAASEYKLIEINTRHWDQHSLGLASGVNLTWVAYCDLTQLEIPPARPTVQATWIAEDALLTRIVRGVFRRELRVSHLWRKVSSPQRTYGIFSLTDPIPFLRYFFGTLFPGLAKALGKKVNERVSRKS